MARNQDSVQLVLHLSMALISLLRKYRVVLALCFANHRAGDVSRHCFVELGMLGEFYEVPAHRCGLVQDLSRRTSLAPTDPRHKAGDFMSEN